MKKIIVVIIVAIAAALLFKQYSSHDDKAVAKKEPAIETNSTPTASEATPSTPTPSTPNSSLVSLAAPGARVFIISPQPDEIVTTPVTIKFGVENMAITKAGDTTEFSGHHHLLLNLKELPDMSMPLPATEQIIHFGGGQTETTIELTPGKHSLRLLLGNFAHVPHATPILSDEINITVSK